MNNALNLSVLLPLAVFAAFGFQYCRGAAVRAKALLAVNLLFLLLLMIPSPVHLLVLFAVAGGNYVGLKLIERSSRRDFPAAALIAADVVLLALSFEFPSGLFARSWPVRFPFLSIIGSSFLFLRLVHLAAETRDGSLSVSFVDYLNFLFLFPSYLSGPLDRYPNFCSALRAARPMTWRRAYESVSRLVTGVFKRNVLTLPFAALSLERIRPHDAAALPLWKIFLAVFCYAATVYLNFSGTMDLAVGLGGILGLDLPENFDCPFIARNIQDFWHRFHITLSLWLRDYVYFPVAAAAARSGRSMTAAAAAGVLATFVLGGLWHGGTWPLALFGLYHSVGFMTFAAYRRWIEARLTPQGLARYRASLTIRVLATLATMAFVTGGYLIYSERPELLSAVVGKL